MAKISLYYKVALEIFTVYMENQGNMNMQCLNSNIIPFHKQQNDNYIFIDESFTTIIKNIINNATINFGLINIAITLFSINDEKNTYLMIDNDSLPHDTETNNKEKSLIICTEKKSLTAEKNTPTPSSLDANINFKNKKIGSIIVIYSEEKISEDEAKSYCETISIDINCTIHRYLFRQKNACESINNYWVGCSSNLLKIEKMLIHTAKTQIPIVLYGNKGSGKIIAAQTIHYYHHNNITNFFELNCEQWDNKELHLHLKKTLEEMPNGTLFLRNVDKISSENFYSIEYLFRKLLTHKTIHLILSTSSLNTALLSNTELSEWLEFNAIAIALPDLAQRKDDIPALINYFISCSGHTFILTDDAFETLKEFNWPSNVPQLQGMIQKITALTEDRKIDSSFLCNLFPSFKKNTDTSRLHKLSTIGNESPHAITYTTQAPSAISAKITSINNFLGVDNIDKEHPALIKAINFITDNFQHNISMADVSSRACMSASHLSYLFKQRLQLSFKQVIIEVRIEKAKYYFQKMPARQITQVCTDVGFSDLSHFEKTFKRVVGVSPSHYRNQFRKPLSTNY